LTPYAWIEQVHQSTVDLADLVSFRCSAWCHDPAEIPPTKELWVVEPPVAAVETPPVKRVLSYPLKIQFSIRSGPELPMALPPPLLRLREGVAVATVLRRGASGDVLPLLWRQMTLLRPMMAVVVNFTGKGKKTGARR